MMNSFENLSISLMVSAECWWRAAELESWNTSFASQNLSYADSRSNEIAAFLTTQQDTSEEPAILMRHRKAPGA